MEQSFITVGRYSFKYKQHCGPTAITNLILSYRPELDPDEVFRKVARIGTSHLIYWNMDFHKIFGGTSNALAGAFIRMSLREYGLDALKVRFRGHSGLKKLRRATDKDHAVFLVLTHHPKYKNHHVLCYGVKDTESGPALLLADGWKGRPVLMPYKWQDMVLSVFYEIG